MNFIWFGDIHGPRTYKFVEFRRAFVSQTPVSLIRMRGTAMKGMERQLLEALEKMESRDTVSQGVRTMMTETATITALKHMYCRSLSRIPIDG